jgi:hypothetical protein
VSESRSVRRLTAAEFCQRVVPALSEREAENGLTIGLARRLATQADSAQDALLLAIEEAGDVVGGGAVWTPPHDVVATRLPAGTADLLAEACARSGWAIGGASGPDSSGYELAEALARRTQATVRVRMRHRVYELTHVEAVSRAAGAMRSATVADLDLPITSTSRSAFASSAASTRMRWSRRPAAMIPDRTPRHRRARA